MNITKEMFLKNCFMSNLKTIEKWIVDLTLKTLDEKGIKYVYGSFEKNEPGYYVVNEEDVHYARGVVCYEMHEFTEYQKDLNKIKVNK